MTLRLNGSTSGYVELDSPATGDSSTILLPTGGNGTLGRMQLATAQNSTSGTSIDFTGIPSWVKRVTVMFSGVSTNGTSNYLVQLGSGSFTTSGYVSTGNAYNQTSSTDGLSSTAGFVIASGSAAYVFSGHLLITAFGSNKWAASHNLSSSTNRVNTGAGDVTLSGTLDRIRITTTSGTDTFDAGSVNILYEG